MHPQTSTLLLSYYIKLRKVNPDSNAYDKQLLAPQPVGCLAAGTGGGAEVKLGSSLAPSSHNANICFMLFMLPKSLVGTAYAQASYGAPNGFGNGAPSNGYGAPPSNTYGLPNGGYGVDPEIAALAENIPGGGVPGEDYPIFASVPETGFSCDAQAVQGYYADTEAGCQVFHICQDRALRRQQDSFLCPNGTIFNQQYLVCDWWFNFDCSQAESFYSVNELIGVVPNGYSYGPGINGNGNGIRNGAGRNGNGRNGNGYGGPPSNAYGAP
ncbi:pro-resilin-like [Penaeus japonicus]|uniref:pro-resilin-like n=1 Tax=Penaeus japonicus TaxID=27405 RepID=UPI001C70BC18|nr:pro-resilin-like [Penaeus japonicus]